MKPFIETPPRTMMEVYKSLPQGTLAELIDNQLYMSPSPVFLHQKTVQQILRKLMEIVTDPGKGEVLVTPFDVYLDEERNAVQPDIIVVLNSNLHVIDLKGHIHGVPDMLIEILSRGNKEHDLVRKKELYERFAVKEYWIVDPDTKHAQGFALNDAKRYQVFAEDIGIMQSKLLQTSITF
jgi:Uma2 family endonuclease